MPETEISTELFESFGLNSKKDYENLQKKIKQLLKKEKQEQNFCPLMSKLTHIEQILDKIVTELFRIFKTENSNLHIDSVEYQKLFQLKFMNLAACRYSIEDAQSAIDSYKIVNFDKQIGYLLYYGLLQAMYVQQDSLKSLFLLITNRKELKEKKGEKSFFYDFNKIRETRKNVLHSTDRLSPKKDDFVYFKNYVIVQSEMTKRFFRLVERTKSLNNLTKTESKEESKSEMIDLYELIELQETILFRELEKYLEILRASNSFSQLENI